MVDDETKRAVLPRARALLFPVRWHEPFGIAVIEAMSQGLPVIGSPYGSLPELISKEAGFIASNSAELEKLVSEDHSKKFDPAVIRKYVEDNFNITKHSKSYLVLYEKVISGKELNPVMQDYIMVVYQSDLINKL